MKDNLARTPNHPNVLGNLGMTYLLLQEDSASDYFEKAVEKGLPVAIAYSYSRRIELIESEEVKMKLIFEPSKTILKDYIARYEEGAK